MNERMRAFADEWLTGENTGRRFYGKGAADYAGYDTSGPNPYQVASKILNHPEVQAYIKQRLDEFSMSAAEVLMRFTDIARAEVGDVVTLQAQNDGSHRLAIDPHKVVDNKQFIKNFGFDSNGHPKIEFHDSMAALRDIARIRGMLKDGLEVSGPGGGAVPVAMQVQFVDPDGSEVHLTPKPPETDDDLPPVEDAHP